MFEASIAIIDANFYGHRCRFTNSVFFGHRPVGCIHAVFEAILNAGSSFGAKRIALAFDTRHSVRRRDFPPYKSGRTDRKEALSDSDKEILKSMYAQMDALPRILQECGFDALRQNGMEADDLIAMVCRNYPNERIIIVSQDRDLYQLIANGAVIAKPKGIDRYEMYGYRNFKEEYGIEPSAWAWVKAIAGCDSDNVPSIGRNLETGELEYRIGEATALKYLQGEMDEGSGMYKFFKGDVANARFKRNWNLVRLPHERTKPVVLGEGRPNVEALRNCFEKYEFKDMLEDRWDEWMDLASGK